MSRFSIFFKGFPDFARFLKILISHESVPDFESGLPSPIAKRMAEDTKSACV